MVLLSSSCYGLSAFRGMLVENWWGEGGKHKREEVLFCWDRRRQSWRRERERNQELNQTAEAADVIWNGHRSAVQLAGMKAGGVYRKA